MGGERCCSQQHCLAPHRTHGEPKGGCEGCALGQESSLRLFQGPMVFSSTWSCCKEYLEQFANSILSALLQWLFLVHPLSRARRGNKLPTRAAQTHRYRLVHSDMSVGPQLCKQNPVVLFSCWGAGLHAAVCLLIKLTEIN